MNRRGFLQLFAGACAAAAAGIKLPPAIYPQDSTRAAAPLPTMAIRHIAFFDGIRDMYVHRFDVRIGHMQYGVDAISHMKTPDARVLEPALIVLADRIEQDHGTRFAFVLPPSVERV
jgi:hypothetical protein